MDVAYFIFSRKLLNLPGVQCWCAPGHRPLIPGYNRPARYCTAPIPATLEPKIHIIAATITIATSQSNDFQYWVQRCIINNIIHVQSCEAVQAKAHAQSWHNWPVRKGILYVDSPTVHSTIKVHGLLSLICVRWNLLHKMSNVFDLIDVEGSCVIQVICGDAISVPLSQEHYCIFWKFLSPVYIGIDK